MLAPAFGSKSLQIFSPLVGFYILAYTHTRTISLMLTINNLGRKTQILKNLPFKKYIVMHISGISTP